MVVHQTLPNAGEGNAKLGSQQKVYPLPGRYVVHSNQQLEERREMATLIAIVIILLMLLGALMWH